MKRERENGEKGRTEREKDEKEKRKRQKEMTEEKTISLKLNKQNVFLAMADGCL